MAMEPRIHDSRGSRNDPRPCRMLTVSARPGFVRTLVLFAVFLRFVLVLLVALETLQLLKQPVHLVFKITEPALDAGIQHRGATGATHAGASGRASGASGGAAGCGEAGGAGEPPEPRRWLRDRRWSRRSIAWSRRIA